MATDDPARISSASFPPRLGRRGVLVGFGALAAAGLLAACGTNSAPATARASGTPPSEQPAPTATVAANPAPSVTGGPTQAPAATTQIAPPATLAPPTTLVPTTTFAPTAAASPTVVLGPTATPVALPPFSSGVVTADMTDANQWNTIVLESSGRTLANNAYTVRVTKWPDGRGLLSWGDWLPKNTALSPQFGAEVEMQLTGDSLAAGGILFLFNYVSQAERQQYLVFLARADGRFKIAQQLPGGIGHDAARVDWTPTNAIKQGAGATNVVRVIARGGTLICGVNGQQLAQLPVPAELATFRGFALAADVPIESTLTEATATFRNLRYEPFA